MLIDWLKEVDSWNFWNYYFYAIACIITAFVQIAILVFLSLYKNGWLWQFLNLNSVAVAVIVTILVAVIRFLTIAFFYKKRDIIEIHPHNNVYTRIGVSTIHGVGIIAIQNIPKDEIIFFPDDDPTVNINRSEVEKLHENIKRLYDDFCVKRKDLLICPVSFNKLTPAWYLNNSKTPNVYCDENLVFRAARDIAEGEELTSDYDSYSD